MGGQYFSLALLGVENSSDGPVLAALGREIKTLEPEGSMIVDYVTPDSKHAFKILMVQDDVSFAFNISKSSHVLSLTESIGGGSVTLDIAGPKGKFKIYVQDGAAIVIEDISDAYVLKHNGASAQFYRFVVSGSHIDVRPYNLQNPGVD